MEKSSRRSDRLSVWIILIAAGYFLIAVLRSINFIDLSGLKILNTIFISILMQAIPFMLIGIFVSAAMHVFLSDEMLIRIFPSKYGLGFVTAMLGGIFFPVCECAIVPVTTGLVKKGVALPIALVFMLSAPILNPIVILSTLYAFPGKPEIALMRVCFGLLIALMTGLIIFALGVKNPLLHNHSHHHDHHCGSCCDHAENMRGKPLIVKISAMFTHAGEEFFDVGKYLIIGAFLTSLLQTVIPRSVFLNLWGQSGLSLLIMMVTAFLFSACSTSDAFLARSFMDQFSMGSIMGFLVFGPMMDIKNMLMLLGNFKKSFVMFLCALIFCVNFVSLYLLGRLFL